MEAFFATGRVADLMLLLLAAEAGWIGWRRRTGRPAPAAGPFLLAGAALALALRFALTGAPWWWIAPLLAAAGAAHALDLARRWPRRGG